MDKKKAIVIAVVLFLLIGLGTFVFANPSGERLDGDGTDSVTEMDGNSEVDDNNTDGEEETIEGEEEPAETEEDEEDGDVIPVYNDQTGNSQNGGSNQGSNNNNNNQGGSQVEDNSRYLAALEALEKAEASFSQSDLDYANSLIDALENNGNKTDLSNRADVVQNVIDVETLVKNLQTKVDESENITNINDARDYRANEEIIAKVDELAASTKKDELTSILNDLSKVLDDTKAPIISGIDNGIVTVLDVSLAVDESDVKVYVNGEEKSLADLTFDKEGDYTVKVVDKAYNETTLQFAIDKTVPEFNVASGTHSDTAMNIVVTDDHFASIHVVNQDTGDVKDYTTNEITLEDEATYHITAYDKAGSYKDIYVAIDKTAPTVNATGTGVNNFFRDEEVTLTAFDKFLTEVTVNGETYGKEEFTYVGNNENATFTKVFTEEGKYDVVAKDKFGHETTYTFVIDHTAPVLNGVVDGGTYKEATLEIVEENLHTAKISKDSEKAENFTSGYKVSESGTYTVTLIDKAYNRLEVTFTIDADAPVYKELGLVNITHYIENNNGTTNDLKVANIGDTLRIMVRFDEALATNPMVKIGDMEPKEMHLDSAWASYYYWADVTLTKDMNLSDGEIDFSITEYADSVGNVGVELNKENINHSTYDGVKLDTTLPVFNFNNGMITSGFTVEVTEENFDYMLVKRFDNGEETIVTDKTYELSGDADNVRFEITAYDKAGNVSEYRSIYLDNQAPVLTATGFNGSETSVENGKSYQSVTVNITDGSLKKAVLVKEDGSEEVLATFEDNYYNDKMVYEETFDEEGTYTIKGVDRNNQESSISFTIDKTPATRDYSTLYFEETGKTAYDVDGNKAYYMKNGDSVLFRIAFHEELRDVPTVTIGGQNIEMTNKGLFENNDGENIYVYEGTFKIDENESEMPEGKLNIVLSNVFDLAGNETTDELVLNQTPTSNNRVIIYDRTAPVVYENNSVGSNDHFSSVQLKLFDHEGITHFVINGKDFSNSHSGKYIDINGNNIVTFLEGENTIEFSDAAGNKTVYTFVLDTTSPVVNNIVFKNIDNSEYPYLAKAGDRVWLYVNANEKLMQEPTVVIDGQELKKVQYENGDNWDQDWEKYVFEYIVPQDALEENISFEVTNIVDQAGNTLHEVINNDDTTDYVLVDRTAPDLTVNTVVDGVSTSSNPSVHTTDLHDFQVEVKLNGETVRTDASNAGSDGTHWSVYEIGYLADGNYTITAKDIAGNVKTVEFKLDRLEIADSVVGSNLIDTTKNTINNFNSFAIKFNRDLTFTNYSSTNGFQIEMEYSVDGGKTYKKAGTVISNYWTGVLGNSTTTKYEGSTFTVSAGSPIYWSGTKVKERYQEIYDAILATAGTTNTVYVRTIFTVVQPTYTKSFVLDPVVYSDGGQTVSPRGLAQF